MADSSTQNPAAILGDAARFGDVRRRLLFLLGGLIVYRIGTYIPVPGINPDAVARFFSDNQQTIFGIVNMFSGGALQRLSIFTMGVMPYISASIIVQMMAMVVPAWVEYRKEGESGRRKLTEITRYGTLGLALFQSFVTASGLQQQNMVVSPGWQFLFVATITMTTGAMFLMWLGEQITERGVGNGISMIILGGIVAGFPGAVGRTVESGQRRPDVRRRGHRAHHRGARRDRLLRVRGTRPAPHPGRLRQAPGGPPHDGGADHAPAVQAQHVGRDPADLRLEPAAVPGDHRRIRGRQFGDLVGQRVADLQLHLRLRAAAHIVVYAFLIVFFCFFYTALVFNARETADNLKKSGAFIRGIRPGQQTGEYIDKVLTRLTLWGALYITAVCLLPEILVARGGVPFVFGGTSLLIVVVVAMDFFSQLIAHTQSHQYGSLMKRANLMGYGRSGAPQ